MALIYIPTKLPEEVINKIKEDVKNKVYKSRNNAIVNILAKNYNLKKEKY